MRPNAKSFNQTVMLRLKGVGPFITNNCGGWYADFASLPSDVVEMAFGESGSHLRNFLSEMDLQHPDLRDNLERIFARCSPEVFGSLVGLVKLATESGRKDLIGDFSLLDLIPVDVHRHAVYDSYIRCLKSAEVRAEYRKNKKSQAVDMSSFAKKGEEIWGIQPSSFDSLTRYEKPYANEIELAKKRAKRFFDLGCVSMANEIAKSVDVFEAQIHDSYLGFNRMTFNSALVILAKWHEYQLTSPHVLSAWPLDRNYKVVVPGRYFADFDFFERADENSLCWNYSPRIYPLADLEPLTPDMKEIIGMCESHSEYGGKPLFDHYVVMLPGVDYPPLREKAYSFRSDTGTIASFENYDAARHALDRTLLHAGAFSGVVMGERDGKCYFVSVWS